MADMITIAQPDQTEDAGLMRALKKLAKQRSKDVKLRYVNLYEIQRVYLGPEEGGRFGDIAYPDKTWAFIPNSGESQKVYNLRVECFLEEKHREVEDGNKDRRPLYSVLSDGKHHVEIDDVPAYVQGEEQYHYE